MMQAMIATTPEQLYPHFANALNQGDVESIMTLFDAEGQTVPYPGQPPVTGADAVRAVMTQCVAFKPQISYDKMNVLQNNGVALLRSQWRMKATLPDGNQIESTGKGLQVARQQMDGSWRFLIDNPWAGTEESA